MKKGQTNNPNGRPKGKPNRVTADVKKFIETLVCNNLSKMERDINKLEPKDRLIIIERLLQYTIPKQQSVSVEAQIQAEYASLERLLKTAPDEAINEITERIVMLNRNQKKMSKEFLLGYARGKELQAAYVAVYSVNPENREIQIRLGAEIPGASHDDILIQVCYSKEDVLTNVPDEEIKEAVRAYLRTK